MKEENTSEMFVGSQLHDKLNELLFEGDITEMKVDLFHSSILKFHCTAFIYVIDSFPLQDKFLQHACFLNFYKKIKSPPSRVFCLLQKSVRGGFIVIVLMCLSR